MGERDFAQEIGLGCMIPEFEIAKLELHEGDTLVVRVRGMLSHDIKERVSIGAEQLIPDGVKVMVIDDSIELSVLQKV